MNTAAARRKVIIEKPTIGFNTLIGEEEKIRRVAAYARVSTNSDDQKNSYDAQVGHYTKLIKENPNYEFAGIYADEGLSGVTGKRDGFLRMIQDALAGKFDLVLIKSISRLGRNTLLVLQVVRELREKGVEIFFENENLSTLNAASEVMLTIYATLSQEESRRMSMSVKWGIQRRMEAKKASFAYSNFLGLDRQEDESFKINEKEAKIIRRIYRQFMQGMTIRMIAKDLTERGIPTPMGKDTWHPSTVRSILTNEKYKGDLVMGKTYTPDFLTKKVRVNNGQSARYEYTGVLPAIISPEVWELVQAELARRKGAGRGQSGVSAFSSRVVCGDCGGFYGTKVWHSGSIYEKRVLQCNRKYENDKPCETPHYTEEQLKMAFVKTFNLVVADKQTILEDLQGMIRILMDTAELDRTHLDLVDEQNRLHERMKTFIQDHAQAAFEQDSFMARFEEMDTRSKALAGEIESTLEEISQRMQRCGAMEVFIQELSECDEPITAFDDALWFSTANQMTIQLDGAITVQFRSGMDITVKIV